MLRILICDDNRDTVNEITGMLGEMYPERFEYIFAYGEEDFAGDAGINCDILIMDIDLVLSDGVNSSGIDIAGRLKRSNPGLKVIFASAFHEYAQDIFEVEPVYYLQKPVAREKLKAAVDKALDEIGKMQKARFSFTCGSQMITVNLADILYLESDKRLMRLMTTGSEYSFYSKIKDVEVKLDDRFVKTHQSFIVNMEHITRLANDTAFLDDGREIPVSQSRYKEVRTRLTRFLGDSIL